MPRFLHQIRFPFWIRFAPAVSPICGIAAALNPRGVRTVAAGDGMYRMLKTDAKTYPMGLIGAGHRVAVL
jgi:hypothetical protein